MQFIYDVGSVYHAEFVFCFVDLTQIKKTLKTFISFYEITSKNLVCSRGNIEQVNYA